MSNGAFETGRYQTSASPVQVLPIKVQVETKALTIDGQANAYPTGAIDGYPSAQVSKGRRAIGVNARTVTIKFTGTPTGGYKADSPITLPWFDPATFADIRKGDTGTYQSQAIIVVGTSAEKVN